VFDRIPESVKSYVPKNDGSGVWAPDVIKVGGQYYLYYAVSSWGSFVSAVGLMTNPTLNTNSPDYKWTDRGMVVHSSEGEDLNAIDPGACLAPDGTLWLCYGSYHGNIELVELDPKTGLRVATNSPVSIIANHSEAADIISHEGFYYLFVNHGSCCNGTNSSYNIRVGRSKKITGPYLDKNGENLANGAGTLFVASEGKDIGPGHFGLLMEDGVEKFSCHYEGVVGRAGRSILDVRPLLWQDGWPVAGENVPEGTYQIRSQRTGNVLQVSTNGVRSTAYLSRDFQKWTITPAGSGFYKIINAQTGTGLETGGARVDVASFTGADNQLWKIDGLTDGTYRIVSKLDHLALTAPSGNVGFKTFTGDDSQRWLITAP